MLKFQFPKKHIQNTSEPQLVDSLVLVGDGMVATKCALHGVIYLWDLMATLAASGEGQQTITVTPIRVLTWSNTDNYFMNMGCHSGESTSKFFAVGIPVFWNFFVTHTHTHEKTGSPMRVIK
jgi:hypothetical protein